MSPLDQPTPMQLLAWEFSAAYYNMLLYDVDIIPLHQQILFTVNKMQDFITNVKHQLFCVVPKNNSTVSPHVISAMFCELKFALICHKCNHY